MAGKHQAILFVEKKIVKVLRQFPVPIHAETSSMFYQRSQVNIKTGIAAPTIIATSTCIYAHYSCANRTMQLVKLTFTKFHTPTTYFPR
jgi:hypothetical protein